MGETNRGWELAFASAVCTRSSLRSVGCYLTLALVMGCGRTASDSDAGRWRWGDGGGASAGAGGSAISAGAGGIFDRTGGSFAQSGGATAVGGEAASAGGRSSSGGEGNGGMGGDVVEGSTSGAATLGEHCARAGAFACAKDNEKLALLCDDEQWVLRESCAADFTCDAEEGPNFGVCRQRSCDPGEALCDEGDVAECDPDGFDTRVIQSCRAGCSAGKCIDTDDECAEFDGNCFNGCGGSDEGPGCLQQSECAGPWEDSDYPDFERLVLRVENDDLCQWEECDRLRFVVLLEEQSELAIRVLIGPGWGLAGFDQSPLSEPIACGELTEKCLILPPLEQSYRGVFVVPLSANAKARNLLIEAVEPGTTCP